MNNNKHVTRLEDAAFSAWLFGLNSGKCNPDGTPRKILSKALQSRSKLTEATFIRLIGAITRAGIDALCIEGKFFNQALFEQLAGSLKICPEKLERLTLDLSHSFMDISSSAILAEAFSLTFNLRELRLRGGACDVLLYGLRESSPPLVHLDLSGSQNITDDGIRALLGIETKEPRAYKGKKPDSKIIKTLEYLNVWDTQVTTRGCILALRSCENIKSLVSYWTIESLVLLEMQESNPVSLEHVLIPEAQYCESIFSVISNLCPCLNALTIRKPKSYVRLSLDEVISCLPNLKEFTALQFIPTNTTLEFPEVNHLLELHITTLTKQLIELDIILSSCTSLKTLILEGATPILSSSSCFTPETIAERPKIKTDLKETLTEVKLTTPQGASYLIPDIVLWFMKHLNALEYIHLGSCQMYSVCDFEKILSKSFSKKIRRMVFCGTKTLPESLIYQMVECCPNLESLRFKMMTNLMASRIATLQKEFKCRNIEVKLNAYTMSRSHCGDDCNDARGG